MKRILFIVLLFFCLSATSQTTYYISPTGSDAAAGSIGAPWATLYKATQTALISGDIIHVNAGTYTESHQCNLSVGVSIEGAGKASTTINATNTSNFGCLLSLYSVSGVNGAQHITGIRFQSVRTTSGTDNGIMINGRSNVLIHDCHFQDFRYLAVSFNGRDENSGGGGTTFDPFIAPTGSQWATGNKYYNNTSDNCSTYRHDLHDGSLFGYFGSGHVHVGSQDGFEMYGNTMTQNNGIAGYNGWLVKMANSGFVKNCNWHHNTWTKNQFDGGYLGDFDFPFVFEVWNGRGNNKIDSNTIVNGGIDLAYHGTKNTGTYSWEIIGNNFDCPVMNSKQAVAIILEAGCEGALIKNNTIHQFFNGVIVSVEYFADNASHDNPYHNIEISNNLFSNGGAADASGDTSITNNDNGAYQIYVGGIADSNREDLTSIHIIHNTIACSQNHKPYIGININNNSNRANKDDIVVRDNIVTNVSAYWLNTTNDVGTAITNIQVKNNLLFGNGASNAYNFESPNPPTSPVISGNILGSNPLFVLPNYTLGGGSPALNAGTDGTDIGYTGGFADTIAPLIISVTPDRGAVNQLITVHPTGSFSESLLSDSVNTRNVTMEVSGTPVTITVGVVSGVITITPTVSLSYSTTYTVKFKVGLVDLAGNHLASQDSFMFTTAAAPAPGAAGHTRYYFIKRH